jgi:hypothetical protein
VRRQLEAVEADLHVRSGAEFEVDPKVADALRNLGSQRAASALSSL